MVSVRDFQTRDLTSNLGGFSFYFIIFLTNPQELTISLVANLCQKLDDSQPKSYKHPGCLAVVIKALKPQSPTIANGCISLFVIDNIMSFK